MIFLYIVLGLLGYIIVLGFGVFIGARLNRGVYHGVMHVMETPEGLQYRLELAGDPELLAFQDSVTFKVLPPDYEQLLSRGKLGV